MSTALGIRIENGRPVIDPQELKILDVVEREAGKGKNGREIAETLNRRGFTTRNQTAFSRHNVAHYLRKHRLLNKARRQQVIDLVATGQEAGLTNKQIADSINAKSLLSTTGKPFSASAIRDIIRRRKRK